MTQAEELLAALKRGEELTPLYALDRYKVFALSQRMTPLIRAGEPIEVEMVRVGPRKRVAKYKWAGPIDLPMNP